MTEKRKGRAMAKGRMDEEEEEEEEEGARKGFEGFLYRVEGSSSQH